MKITDEALQAKIVASVNEVDGGDIPECTVAFFGFPVHVDRKSINWMTTLAGIEEQLAAFQKPTGFLYTISLIDGKPVVERHLVTKA